MPDYDARYEIRKANIDDIEAIMNYIEDDWRSGHIMARNRSMFEYEFLNEDSSVNVVIAIDREKNSIEGMIGYLYSSENPDKADVWGSIWKVRDGNMSLLGAEIMRRMEGISGCRYNLGTGANPNTNIPLMRVMFGRTAGKMKHYYKLADKTLGEFNIAQIKDVPLKSTLMADEGASCKVNRIKNVNELQTLFESDSCKAAIPYKDMWYVNKKFFNHPVHDYEVYGICDGCGDSDSYVAAVVLRKQYVEHSSCYRMVDYIGDFSAIRDAGVFFEQLLVADESLEYVDFYCLGMSDDDMQAAGFSVLAEDDENVIPNYFSPFVQKNVDIWVHYPVEGVTFTKADGDQDRPN